MEVGLITVIGFASLAYCCAVSLFARISFRRDAFFIFFCFQALVYLVFSPAGVYVLDDTADVSLYPWFWMYLLVFYFPVLFVTYGSIVRGLPGISGLTIEYRSKKSIWIFSVVAIGLVALYYFRSFSVGYFFRRIGSAEAAQLFSGLGGFDLLLIKFHDLAAPPILFLLVLILRQRHSPFWLKVLGIIFSVDIFLSAIVNSRIALVFAFFSISVMMLWTGLEIKKLFVRLLLVFPVFIYFLIVLINFRANSGNSEFGILSIINPFMISVDNSQVNNHEWLDRLNCLDLISKMTPVLEQRGFALGEAWYNPFLSLFGPLWGAPEALTLKSIGMTTAKAYMMKEYTDISAVDYQSCNLTDVYGNFGPIGFVVSAIISGAFFGLITRMLVRGGRGWILVLIVSLSYYFMLFEQEFFNFAIGWIRIVPWLVALGLIIPIRVFSAVRISPGESKESG